MPSFADFRSRFPSLQDASDEEIIKRTSEVFKLPITEVAQSFDYDISGGKTSQRFGSAVDRYQAGLYGTAEAVTKAAGLEGTSDYLQKQRVRNEAQADISSARAKELGAIESYKDVTGVGTGVDYVTGLAIGSAPYMAEALVTGGVGRLAMTGTRAALAEGRTALAAAEAAKDVAAADKAKQAIAVAERNLSTGGSAAGFAGQYPSGVGEMLSQQREQTGGQTDLPSALGYGAAYTGLGMVGVEGALTRGNLFRNTINFLDKPGGITGAALRTGATAVSTGLKEGVSETLQEMSGQGARMAVDDKAQFFDQDAVERYKESFIGGAALGGAMGGGLGGWRRSNSILPGATTDPTQPQTPANNAIQQAFDQPQTSGTPLTNVTPPPAPPITPSADTTPPPAPIVSGGTTPIAQATQQQSQADAAAQQQQQQQQQQAQRDLTISQFGLAGDTPGTGNFFGRPIFGPAINQVADALAPIAAQLNPAEAAIMDAIVTADQKLGNKLLSFQFNADKIAASVQKGVQAVTTAATKFQIAHVQTVDEAAYILNTLSKSAKGQALEQINAIHEALTGKDTEGYIASQTAKPKGKSNVQQQQQLQTTSGLGTVPVQGGTIQGDGGLTGLLQPGAVQPVGTGVVSGAANDQQAGQLPGEGIRTGPSVAAADDLGGAAQAPQDVSGAPSETTVTTAPSTQNVEGNAPVLGQGVQRDSTALTGTVQTQEGVSPGRVAWEDMDGTGTSFDDLPENLQQVWERAVSEGKATGEVQETLAASAQDTSLAAKARAVLRAALDMVIQPTSRMPEDVAARKREFVAAYWGGARSDALTKVADDLGISKDQAKRWSAELPNFLTVNGQKIKAAVETVAKERGIDIADVLDGLRSIEEQHPTEEMVDEIEGTGQGTSATEEPLSSDQEDIEVDQGQLNKAPEEELNTAEADAGQNDFVISSRKSASLQEQNNAVETNQAKIMRLLDMQDKINEAESIENPPAPKIVSLSEAALEKLGGDVTKLKEHDLLNLAVNAKLTENFELADQLNEELSSRIEKALAKAQKQADQKTQKGTTNAVQEPSAEKVSVPEGAAGGQAVGKGNAKVGKATRVRKAKVEKEDRPEIVEQRSTLERLLPKTIGKFTLESITPYSGNWTIKYGSTNASGMKSSQNVPIDADMLVGKSDEEIQKLLTERLAKNGLKDQAKEVLTPKEQWDALTQQFPGMPPYDVLTKSEKETWDDFANRGFGDIGSVATVLGGADKIAKASEAVTETAAAVVEPAPEQVTEEPTVQEDVATLGKLKAARDNVEKELRKAENLSSGDPRIKAAKDKFEAAQERYTKFLSEAGARSDKRTAESEAAPVEETVQEQVTEEVLAPQLEALPEAQVQRLETHYGEKRNSASFLAKVKEDVVLYATKGAQAVAGAIRDVIKAIHAGVLSVAMIFNPVAVTPPEAFVFVPQTQTYQQEVKAELPKGTENMSQAGKEAYQYIYPAIKDKLIEANKFFVLADKPNGRTYVFNPDGSLLLERKTLYGAAAGDLLTGDNNLPKNRVTPAGLFNLGLRDAARGGGEAVTAGEYDFGKVFVLDKAYGGEYSGTIMHSVWTKEKDAAQRLAALKNEKPGDFRYSFGCINVDKETYRDLITNHLSQMDGAKLFIVPDNQAKVKDYITGNVKGDELDRLGITPKTEQITVPVGRAKQAAGVDRTIVGREEQAPTTQQSRAKQPVVERYTAEELQTSLLDYVNRESLGKDVFVVDELEDLRSLPEFAAMTDEEFAKFLAKEKIDGQTQAFVTENGKAYLLASNIDVGTGRGVFMHEVGVHLGLQEKLPDASFARLVDQIKVWAKLNDGSIENQLAIAASDRVFQSGVSDPVQRRREFVAYFVEAAVNAGLNPKAYENIKSAGLREWMRSLWAAFKNALRKLRGINVDKLSAQDVVDMTYGYAQLAIGAPKFQGSGKIFRKFQMKFAGTGVGQMYGHGMYFTNIPEVAASFAKGKTPQLYGADLAVTDDELMGWATPLSQQSTTVQEAMTAAAKELGVVAGQNVRGGDFYNDLSIQIYKVRTGMRQAPQTKQQVSAAYRLASEWLDTHGVKGIKYGGDNYVIFNEDNIIRVNRTAGIPTGRMDKGRPEVEWGSVQQSRRVDAAVNLLPPKLRSPVRNTTTDLLYQAKKGMLASAITEDVINMASKFMKSAKTYLAAQYARQATRLNHELKIEKILNQFDKLPKNLQGTGEGSVNKYIFDSTREGKWGYIPDERMVGTTLLTVDPDMAKRYDAFPDSAKKLIRDVFEQGYDALDAKQNAIRDAIDREYADRLKAVEGDEELTDKLNKEKKLALSREKKLIGLDSSKPYAYLGRYGDYVVVAKSAEYKDKEVLSKSKDISEAEQERYIGWMAENRSNPAHYVVQFAENMGEANQIADQLKATGNYDMPESFEKELYANEGADLFLAVARLRTLFDKQSEGANPAAEAAIRNLLGDLYLHTVSEANSRKSEFQRLNISGADKDMMRNLATRGRADAHFLAALEHNDAISDAITAMREERNRNRKEASPYFNELLQRHANSMKYETPNVLANAMLRMSNVWYLATNPAFYLQQILQTGVLSLPYMSGRLGYFRSARAMKKAYGDMATLVKGLGVDDHIDFNKAPADVREMLTKLVGMGKIDIGIDSDARVRAGEGGVAAKVMQKLQGVNNRIEAVNRATAAIAAYRGYLDRYKNGDTAAATAYAADVVSNTHGSYDAFNTPRIMQTGAGKVLFQFKRFQIIQISMLLKLINTAFKGASRDEKAVARRALGFIAGHMMVLGGALAVPFVTQFGWLLSKLPFGDDDEPENLELTLRRLINDPVMADLLINGVPGALGVNLGGKLGMGNVFSILPFTDIDFTSRSGAEKMLVGIMGPSAGLGLKFADGLGQMASGEYYKGLESMLPSGVANVMKAGRFATEGITMRNGDVVLKPEEISMFDAAFQAVGLPTTTITDRQFTQRVVAEFDKFYDKRTTEIKGDYVEASRNGDVNGMADAREEWSKLQESRAKNGYKRQPLSDLFKAPSAAAKRERNIAGGVEFSKSNRRFVESLSTL